MRRLINVEALGVGGLDDTISPSDISISNSSGFIEVSLTSNALQNEEKNLHKSEKWSDAKYYPSKSSTDVIAFMSFSQSEKTNQDQSDKIVVVSVSYLENRSEYRKTKVFEYLMNYFMENVITPLVGQYGENHVFLNAMFANAQLGRVVRRYFKKSKSGAKWSDEIPAGYRGSNEGNSSRYDDDDYYEDNYHDEDHYRFYFEEEEDQSPERYIDWMRNQLQITELLLSGNTITITGHNNLKNYVEEMVERGWEDTVEMVLGIFADGSMQGVVPVHGQWQTPLNFPDGSAINLTVRESPKCLEIDPNTIGNFSQIKDKIDEITDQLKFVFNFIEMTEVSLNNELLTFDEFKEKAHQLADGNTSTPSGEGTAIAGNRLKKIVEALGLGGLDTSITESDVSFTLTENRLEENLINSEKSLHGDKPWDNAKYNQGGDINLIAAMSFEKTELKYENSTSLLIFIGFLENRPEYRKTKSFEYIMNYFLENVVNPSVQQYGENNVILDAYFANSQLGRVVKRYFSKNGKGAKWADGGDYTDEHARLRTLVTGNGGTVVDSEKDVVKNFDVNQYVDLVYDVYGSEGNRSFIDWMPVGITSNGDVVYSWYNDSYSFSYSGSKVEFEYLYGQNIFSIHSTSLNELKELYNENVKNNLTTCFGSSVTFNVKDTGESLNLDQLSNKEEEKIASNKLKKIVSAKGDLTNKVYDYLKENYPEDVLQWVKEANWTLETIPLSEINMAQRPGGRNMGKVDGIANAIKNGEKMSPVVLVKQSDGRYQIADGYHRTLGFKRAEKEEIQAYVATGVGDDGPWDEEMHAKKLNVEPGKTASLNRRSKLAKIID